MHFKVTDVRRSAYYVDPESRKLDSERALIRRFQRKCAGMIRDMTLGGAQLSAEQKTTLADTLLAAMNSRSEEFGLHVESIEIRGAVPVEEAIADKVRAYDVPMPDPEAPGHNLAADYWAEHLTPPYFEKQQYGSNKIARTPAATSLEWSIPSPPDFHHFHQTPKMVVSPEHDEAKQLKPHH
jgi:hypothetical protein